MTAIIANVNYMKFGELLDTTYLHFDFSPPPTL